MEVPKFNFFNLMAALGSDFVPKTNLASQILAILAFIVDQKLVKQAAKKLQLRNTEVDYVLSQITDPVVRFVGIDSISQCQSCESVLFKQMGKLVHKSVIVSEFVGKLS